MSFVHQVVQVSMEAQNRQTTLAPYRARHIVREWDEGYPVVCSLQPHH